jgi:cell division protein ZapE
MASANGPLRKRIDALVASDRLTPDAAQDPAIAALDALLAELAKPRAANKASALGWLFAAKPKTQNIDAPRGLYLYGGVGRGKTMLMDEAFALAAGLPRAQTRRRAHFHAFMADIHNRIHAWRQDETKSGDPIPHVAESVAQEAQLLAFDEFAVTDAADAMILARLFTELFARGVTVIATSNVAPDNLYANGLNRSFFVPFIALIKERMVVLELASPTDHRMAKVPDGDRYVSGSARFDAVWQMLLGTDEESGIEIRVKGRNITFPRTAGGLLRTDFDTLCRKPLGASDYLAICERFHTLCLEGVPVMEEADRNAAKRFIALIDTLYDTGIGLIVQAEARPAALYMPTHGTEAFEFKRIISRLQEMQASDWGG